jgi:hypothetical protein
VDSCALARLAASRAGLIGEKSEGADGDVTAGFSAEALASARGSVMAAGDGRGAGASFLQDLRFFFDILGSRNKNGPRRGKILLRTCQRVACTSAITNFPHVEKFDKQSGIRRLAIFCRPVNG